MLAGMGAGTFHEWQEYDRIEPFGEYREELRHGQKMALYANYHRDTEKRGEPFTCCEFMNFIERPEVAEAATDEDPEMISARIGAELFRM